MGRRTSHPLRRGRGRAGFTLVELLVVLLIISIIAAVTLPVVIPAISHRQVSESARIIQGGLIAARDSALRANAPHGIRFLPDSTYNGTDPTAPGRLNPFKTLASNRFIPIEQPPNYSEGKVFLSGMYLPSYWVNDTLIANGASALQMYNDRQVLMMTQAVLAPIPGTSGPVQYSYENPTSWYWNIRVGDKVQVHGLGKFYTVVGPMQVGENEGNPEKFVNIGSLPATLRLPDPNGVDRYPEILFLTDGLDGDGDGYVDNGWDGLDNDGNRLIDDIAEWSEVEDWPAGLFTNPQVNDPWNGVSYQIVRQPVPSPGARETVLPESVVVDLTGWALNQPERSRLPVDPLSGNVDILLDPSGRVIPATRYSSPSSFGMNQSFYHIWVGERSDLAELTPDAANPGKALPLVTGGSFFLPMPLGMNRESDPNGPNSYDLLVNSNATLPYLKGEMRLLTLSTRTGNLITTDRPIFSVLNPSQPYHAPQTAEQGDAQ
jgi:prepilin-type N-terminal cleavage/methylation domain-containing protein